MPKWFVPLIIVFLLFVVYNDPTAAGEYTRSFVGALGDLFSKLGEFLATLFGSDPSTATGTTTPTLPTGAVSDTIVQGQHTNVHSHPVPAP